MHKMSQNPKICIVPSAKLFKNDDPYSDRYEFVNSYVKRLIELQGLPIGLMPCDGYVSEEYLDTFDSFLITGGLQIHPYHFQVVEHCYKKHKKLLGVCLGLQCIHSFFKTLERADSTGYSGNLLDLYINMKKEKHMFVLPIAGHWQHNITRDSIDKTKHIITIKKNTMLASIVGYEKIAVSSMHNYAANEVPNTLVISAISEDGSVEAIEYSDNIIGVQFHPEVDSSLGELFRFLIS